jgi:HEAT repeat protein
VILGLLACSSLKYLETMKPRCWKSIAACGCVVLWLSSCNSRGSGSGGAPPATLYQGQTFAAWIAQAEEARGESRLQAIRTLGAVGPAGGAESRAAVSALLAALADPGCRAAAALSLGSFGPDARVAVPPLVRALRDVDQDVRTGAAAALTKIGPEAIPPLVAAVSGLGESPPFYGENGTWFDELVRVKPQSVVVGLVFIALATLLALFQGFKLWTRHRERLARIERGLDPDSQLPAAPSARSPQGRAA